MITLWAFLGLAVAAPAKVGMVDLNISPGAKVAALPPARPDRLDLVIRHNLESLNAQFEGLPVAWIRDVDVRGVGGGTWLISILSRAAPDVPRWEVAGGRLRLWTGPPIRTAKQTESVQNLEGPRTPASPPALAAHPLWGDAWQFAMAADRWPLVPPERGRLAVSEDLLADLATPPSWTALSHYRSALRRASDGPSRAAALGRLAEGYLALGAPREARYYLGELLEVDPSPSALLRAADADLRLDRVDEARALCVAARGHGLDASALSCLARIALKTGTPDPTAIARALIDVAEGPVHRLLAVELLVADHRWAEATPVLEKLVAEEGWPLMWAQLGDAKLVAGDRAGARDAWRKAALDRELAPIVSVRLRLAALLDAGPTQWGRELAWLLERAERPGPEGLESRYLIAQIAERWGDDAVASDALARLWDADPAVALRSDVAERLISACRARSQTYQRLGRKIDQISLLQTCWRPDLDRLVSNPGFLQDVADASADLGLLDLALNTQQRALTVSTRRGADDPQALLRLATLYRLTGRPKEALDTLVWVERLGKGPEIADGVWTERAAAAVALGDIDGAIGFLHRVRPTGAAGPAARATEAVVLARSDRCEKSVPLLRGLLEKPGGLDPTTLDELRVTLARCRLRAGDAAEARAIAATVDPTGAGADEATWIDGAAAGVTPAGKLPEIPLWRKVAEATTSMETWLAETRKTLGK